MPLYYLNGCFFFFKADSISLNQKVGSPFFVHFSYLAVLYIILQCYYAKCKCATITHLHRQSCAAIPSLHTE